MKQFQQRHPTAARVIKYAALAAVAAACVYATAALVPFVLSLQEEAAREAFRAQIESFGLWGVLVMLAIQIAQIVLAIIPGEPVEVLAGVMYGGWGGLLLCEAGILIGQSAVFLLVRKYGRPFVELFFAKKSIEEFSFLRNTGRLELTTFILYFIPGTPKDILCYVAGLTPIKLSRFLIISMIARIPSVVSSTFAGAALGSGNLWTSVAIFAVIGVVGVAGILVHNRLMKRFHREDSTEG